MSESRNWPAKEWPFVLPLELVPSVSRLTYGRKQSLSHGVSLDRMLVISLSLTAFQIVYCQVSKTLIQSSGARFFLSSFLVLGISPYHGPKNKMSLLIGMLQAYKATTSTTVHHPSNSYPGNRSFNASASLAPIYAYKDRHNCLPCRQCPIIITPPRIIINVDMQSVTV